MAKQLNSYEVKLAFTADTRAAKAQLQDLQSQLTNISTGTSFSAKGLPITNEIQKGMDAAAQLKVLLEDATNVNTGKLDLTKFESSLRSGKVNLQELAGDLKMLGPEGARAFSQLAIAVNNAETPIISMNAHMQEFFTTLKNTARWQISSSILHGFMGALQSAYGYAKDLNESLTNIRIVTGYSSERMADFAKEANNAAKALSTTTNEYANASLIYFQQGLSDEEVKARTDVTVRMAQVTGQAVETTSDQLTAIWNNFAEGSENLEYYADVITALGAATASSSEEISTGLNKFAAAAKTVGLSYEYATAALATVTATTRQSADTVGTAFRTLFSRLEGLKLGETLEDGVDLNKYSEALNKVGISILDQQDQLKDMDTILQDLAARWQTLEKNEKVALATTVGGVRQYTTLMALMDNWDFMEENLETARQAGGTLADQAQIYAESWEAAQKQVRAALEGIYQSVINDKFFIYLNKILAGILEFINKIIDNMGGVKGILLLISTLVTTIYSKEIPNAIKTLNAFVTGTQKINVRKQVEEAAQQFGFSEQQTKYLQQQVSLQNQIEQSAKDLNNQQLKFLELRMNTLQSLQQEALRLQQEVDKIQESLSSNRIAVWARANKNTEYDQLTQRLGSSARLLSAVTRFGNGENSVESLKQSFGSTENLLDYVNQIHNEFYEEAPGWVKGQMTQFRDFLIKNQASSLEELFSGNNIANVERFTSTLSNFWENVFDEGTTNAIAALREKIPEKLRKQFDEIIEQAQRDLEDAELKAQVANKNADNLAKDTQKKTDDALKANKEDPAERFTDLGTAMMQAASGATMLYGTLASLTESAKEGNLTVSQLVMSVPSLVMGFTSLSNALKIVQAAGFLVKASLGEVILVIAAVIAILKAIDYFVIHGQENAQKAIDKSIDAFEEEKQKVKELENEFNNLNNRIKELEALKNPTFVEETELNKLRAQKDLTEQLKNSELELLEVREKEAAKKVFEQAGMAWKYNSVKNGVQVDDDSGTSYFVNPTREQRLINAQEQRENVEKYLEQYQLAASVDAQRAFSELQPKLEKIQRDFALDMGSSYEDLFLKPILRTEEFLNGYAEQNGNYYFSAEFQRFLEQRGIALEDFTQYLAASQDAVKDTLENGPISEINISELNKQFGLDDANVEEYAEHLKSVADEEQGINDKLAEQGKAAELVAIGHLRLNRGLQTLSSNSESWFKILRAGKATTEEYHSALKGVREATADILNINKNSLSAKFFDIDSGNLELLEEAVNGSTEAIEKLRLAAANDILIKIKSDNELGASVIQEVDGFIATLQDMLANSQFKIGNIDDSSFIAVCDNIIRTAKMTADQATEYFKALGYDVEVKYVKGETHTTQTRQWTGMTLGAEGPIPIPADTVATETTTQWIPAVKAITYRGSAGGTVNFSQTSAGGAGRSSSGGSSKKEVKTAKNFEDEIDRYHKINAEIANQERLLTNLGKAKDRAYGKDKVAAIQAEFDALGKHSALLSEKLEEAKEYRATDVARLSTFGGVIDENGVISNYKEMYAAQLEAINDAYAVYNASVQDEAAKEALQKAEDHYDSFKDAISKFEGSQEQVEDLVDAIADNYYERLSKKIEQINAAVEVRVTIDEDSLKKVQHALDMTDDFAFFGVERVSMLQTELDPLLDKMDVTRRQIVDLVRQGQMTEFTDEIIDNIRDAQGNLMDYEKQLKELNATLREEFPNAVQEATDAIDNFGSTFKHYSSVLDHYKDLLDLTGRSQRDFGLNMRLAAAQTKVASDATSAAVANYRLLLQSQEETQKLLDNAIASGDRDEMSYWKKQLDEVTQKVQSAKEDILTAWKETLQAAANEYEVTVNQTITTLERQIAPFLSLDAFADAYKKSKDILDEYVTSNEQIYQLNKLVRQVEDVLSKSTSDAAAAKMNELKNEIDARKQILDIEGESHNLSEYDIEYLQKKYQLTLAQMQLEDAQDAKTTMRLSRDASGNYSYIYTANQDNIDQAAQNYEDKLRELEKLSEDYIEQLSDQIISNYQAMTKELSSVRAEDFDNEEDYQKKLDEIRAYYLERDNYFKSEMRKALNDLGTTYNDVTFGIIENHGDLETSHFDLAENTARANEEMEDAWVHWKDTTDEVKDEFHDIVGDINEDIDSVEDKSDELKDKIENEVYPILRDFLKNTATDVQSWQETYVRSIDNAIQANYEFLASIEALKNTSFSADQGLGIAEPIVQEVGLTADVAAAMADAGKETLAEAGKSGTGPSGTGPEGSNGNSTIVPLPTSGRINSLGDLNSYQEELKTKANIGADRLNESTRKVRAAAAQRRVEEAVAALSGKGDTYNYYQGDFIGPSQFDQQANTPINMGN